MVLNGEQPSGLGMSRIFTMSILSVTVLMVTVVSRQVNISSSLVEIASRQANIPLDWLIGLQGSPVKVLRYTLPIRFVTYTGDSTGLDSFPSFLHLILFYERLMPLYGSGVGLWELLFDV